MKQKDVYVDPNLNLETQMMVEMYFKVKTVNGIEGFVYSEEEFLKKYRNTYTINDLRTSIYYSVYTTHCHNCFQEYDSIIRSRDHFYRQLNSTIETCIECDLVESAVEITLGQKLR